MISDNAPNRGVSIVGGVIAVASLAVALTVYARDFAVTDWIVTLFGAMGIALAASYPLPIRGLRMRRSGLTAEAVFMDLSIGAPIFALGGAVGPTAAALAFALGFGAAAMIRRTNPVTDLPRHGALRVIVCLGMLPLISEMQLLRTMPSWSSALTYAAILSIIFVVFLLGISATTSALTFAISLPRVWERQVRDPRTWIVGVGSIIWATAVRDPMLGGHYYVAIAMWIPVCVTALLLRTIDEQHAELHRLRLVRDAVQAMLGDRDPLPQINAILATLRVPSYDETVSVLAATSTRTENWRTVTTLGPQLSSAGDELRRRILARMKFSGQPYTTLRDDYYVSYAFAARLADGELHGAMIVLRRNDRPLSNEQVHSFTNAAFELAPLLRDMRAIAATQSAATIDQLTGLFNRATTLDRLATVLEEMTLAEHGAVLLLDIDHFKTINDQLGHAAGDDCLRKIGAIMRNAVRGGDTAGRIGGEEFLVVMPGATRDVAIGVAERLRLAVALGGMRYANGEPVTTSIGASVMQIGDTLEALLARADRGLYEAKRQGRNRIVEDQETA
jgi:diguanylate cyclase (GGDEF)-like protein